MSEQSSMSFLGTRPALTQRTSPTWGETPLPEASVEPTSGITVGQVVHFVPVHAMTTACEHATIEEVWQAANGIVSLRFADGQVLHRIGYSAEMLGNSWHFNNQCELGTEAS